MEGIFSFDKNVAIYTNGKEMSPKSNNSANDSAEILDADFGNRVE